MKTRRLNDWRHNMPLLLQTALCLSLADRNRFAFQSWKFKVKHFHLDFLAFPITHSHNIYMTFSYCCGLRINLIYIWYLELKQSHTGLSVPLSFFPLVHNIDFIFLFNKSTPRYKMPCQMMIIALQHVSTLSALWSIHAQFKHWYRQPFMRTLAVAICCFLMSE